MRYSEVIEAFQKRSASPDDQRRAREKLAAANEKRVQAARKYQDDIRTAERAGQHARAKIRSLSIREKTASEAATSFEQPLLEKSQAYALRDRSGSIIGWIEPVGQLLQAKDRSGSVVCWYDARQNKTRDKSGRLVGTGDFLSVLIVTAR